MSLLEYTATAPAAPQTASAAVRGQQPTQLGVRAAALAGVFVSANMMVLGFSGAFDGTLGMAYTTAG
jgi:hypothetical protein